MTLHCPFCASEQFEIIDSCECGPTKYDDEYSVQRANCGACGTYFICEYAETRVYDPNKDDKVDHNAFEIDAKLWRENAEFFEKPKSRRSDHDKIVGAMELLNSLKRNKVPGYIIFYRRDSEAAPPKTAFNKLRNWMGI